MLNNLLPCLGMKRRKEETRAARLRPDQIDAIERLIEIIPELDWSTAIRRGLDLLIQVLRSEVAQTQPPSWPPVFPSITSPPPRGAHMWNYETVASKARSPAHPTGRPTRSAKAKAHS